MSANRQDSIFNFAKFNVDALLALAGELRGQSCTCDVSKAPKSGSLNWVIFVSFDDGIDWVFRSPCTSAVFTDESASKMLVSEAATMKYLRAHCSVPVPEVYSYSGTKDNDIGVPYILQSKAAGRPLAEYDWADASSQPWQYDFSRSLLPLSDQDRHKIIRQLGVIMSRLLEVRFDRIGSIFEDGQGNFLVGECLSPALIWQWRDTIEEVIHRGPFSEDKQYFNSLISAFTSHAKELVMAPRAFFAPVPSPPEYPTLNSFLAATRRWNDFVTVGGKLENSKNRLDYCIAGHFLYNMIPCLSTPASSSFTISHPDLHAGNIFVDEDLNITCIIDWASTTTGPIIELLSTPGLAGSTLPPSSSLINTLRSSFNVGGIKIDSDNWKKAEAVWYFARLVRLLSRQDYKLFKSLYERVNFTEDQRVAESVDYARLFHTQAQLEANKELLAELRQDDVSEAEIKELEDAEFHLTREKKRLSSLAVARKLTLMSEMNSGFVADAKLWRWIENALRPDQNSELPL
ncbi:kinase-like domain-containing protein [Xylariaceae sp. AK1471]|nr:kinase-like domain-containing protein [Xylariaceae sp. AK1471]